MQRSRSTKAGAEQVSTGVQAGVGVVDNRDGRTKNTIDNVFGEFIRKSMDEDTKERKSRRKTSEVDNTRKCVICGTGSLKYPYMHDGCKRDVCDEVIEKVYAKYKQCLRSELGLNGLYEFIRKIMNSDKYGLTEGAIDSNDARMEEIRHDIKDRGETAYELLRSKGIAVVLASEGRYYQYRRDYGRWYREECDINKYNLGRILYLSKDIPKLYIGNTKQVMDWECTKNGYIKMQGFIGVMELIGTQENFKLTDYAVLGIKDIVEYDGDISGYCRKVWKYIESEIIKKEADVV